MGNDPVSGDLYEIPPSDEVLSIIDLDLLPEGTVPNDVTVPAIELKCIGYDTIWSGQKLLDLTAEELYDSVMTCAIDNLQWI